MANITTINYNLVVLISGNGTNLQYLIDHLHNTTIKSGSYNILVKIISVISNQVNAYGLYRAQTASIPATVLPYLKGGMTRGDYDKRLSDVLDKLPYHLIVCAGWMRILTNGFLKKHPFIINLHPALPGQFPGAHAKEDAYKAFLEGKITETGCMVHWVIPEIDAGEVIITDTVKLFHNMSIYDVRSKIEYKEKLCLLQSIKQVIKTKINYSINSIMAVQQNNIGSLYTLNKAFEGKVRNVYEILDNNKDCHNMLFVHSDRCSAFDYHICDIVGKGSALCETASWWFQQTKHIMNNHYIAHKENLMLVEKCLPIMIEVVVRGYITGSLWRNYSKGVRTYCGVDIPEDLKNNQKLLYNIVTPTTKDEHDEPITPTEIINRGLATVEQWNTMTNKALKLFEFGQSVADKVGLILVDTKYEFGIDKDGNVMLIDEIHTADSSRYWLKDTYQERYELGLNPEKWDKDAVRDYLLKQGFPEQTQNVPEIPEDVKTHLVSSYYQLYQRLTCSQLQVIDYQKYKLELHYYTNSFVQTELYSSINRPRLMLLAGSISDAEHVAKFEKLATASSLLIEWKFASAHKQTLEVMDIIKTVEEKYTNVIWITVAGRSNALSGVVASNSRFPVFACPPFKDKMDMLVNINSSLQCPSKVPVMTVLEPSNVILACQKIFNMGQPMF